MNKYLFEVWKDGKRKMVTDDVTCIPNKEEIRNLKKAGYKIIERSRKGKNEISL